MESVVMWQELLMSLSSCYHFVLSFILCCHCYMRLGLGLGFVIHFVLSLLYEARYATRSSSMIK